MADTANAPAPEAAAAPEAPKAKKRVAAPNQAKYDEEMEAFKAKIAEMQTKSKAVRAKLDENIKGQRAMNDQINVARTLFNEIKTEQKRVKAEKEKFIAQREALKAQSAANRERSRGSRSRGSGKTSVEAIKAEIAELEYAQSTGAAATLVEEKNMVKRLLALQAQLRDAEAAAAGVVAAPTSKPRNTEEAWANVKAAIAAKNAELKDIGERMHAQYQILRGFDPERDAYRATIPALIKERETLSKAINGLYEQKNKLRIEHNKRRDEYREYMFEVKRARAQARKKEYEAEAELRAERQRKWEEEEAKKHPWEREMAVCDALVVHLEGLKPTQTVEEQKTESTSTFNLADGTSGRAGKRAWDDEGDDWFGDLGGKKKKGKKKGKKGKKKNVVETLTFDFESLAYFKDIGLTPPALVSELDATIKAVKEKKEYFNTKPRPAKKKGKKAAAASGAAAAGAQVVSTPYGPGVVGKVRDDGVTEVNLTGFGGIAYLQADAVTKSS